MAMRDGSYLRRTADHDLFAGFQTYIEQISKASKTYVQLPKLYGSEGRIMPSKGNWSWLICWFWNTYKINFKGQLQTCKTYVPPYRNSMAVRDGPCLRRAADRDLYVPIKTHIEVNLMRNITRRQLVNCLPMKENRPLMMLRCLGRHPLQ